MGPCWQQPGKTLLNFFAKILEFRLICFQIIIRVTYVPMIRN
ncbi:uncharacterized protein SCDLUD_003052 [Saccharomycodes ludwigii]|nr:hypothetical protein SCDLUD_003052 [Saccharomycodes ludwigii]KAH3901555.1 hypothetical protein SCDLUD_003052 [Saccharomycodes ludwigii]